jgi:hypothetical protein
VSGEVDEQHGRLLLLAVFYEGPWERLAGWLLTTVVAVSAVPVRKWTYSFGQWTSDDGYGRPELVARLFTPAGRAITQLWLREGT